MINDAVYAFTYWMKKVNYWWGPIGSPVNTYKSTLNYLFLMLISDYVFRSRKTVLGLLLQAY